MTWITKDLTLDLLAIAIDGLNKAFDKIKAAPDDAPGQWPPQDPAPAAAPQPQQQPAVEQPQAQPQQQAQPQAQPQQPAADAPGGLRAQAQTILRTIAQTEGASWIVGTLFAGYGVDTLDAVPDDKLQDVIDYATQHQQGAAA